MHSITEPDAVQQILDSFPHAVCVKSSKGLVLHSNVQYQQVFGGELSAVGRLSQSYLDQTIVPVSKSSDDLILAGCTRMEFEHAGCDADGRSLQLRTYKQSLLGAGHPQLAIFSSSMITRVEKASTQKILGLARHWQLFLRLDARDQEIAKMLAQGERIKTVSAQFDVSEKTIDNRRNVILSQLALSRPTELTKLLVRLQDNGFSDFGL